MSGPQLRQIALMIVAQHQPMSPYELRQRLQRDYGASHADANRTLLELLRDGHLRSGPSGITLRARSGHDSHGGNALATVGAVLGIVASLLTIWEVAARTDFIQTPGPVEWIQAAIPTQDATTATTVVPNVVGQDAPRAAQNIGAAGLSPQGEFEPSSTVPFGQVIRTDPPAGTTVPRNSFVVFYIAVSE